MTTEQRTDDPSVKKPRFEELTRQRQRQLMTISAIRALAWVVLLVAAYFLLPFTRLRNDTQLAQFTGGVLIVIAFLVAQTLATLRAPYPLLRAVESLATSVPLFLVVFSTTHYSINLLTPGSYSEPMTRLDALYYTFTTFATVGFGDIAPVSQPARFVTLIQMVGGLILVGVVARVLVSAARRREMDTHATTEH